MVKPRVCDKEAVKKFKVVLFDLDGTILDSSKLINFCFNHIMSKYGTKLPEDFVKVNMGLPLETQMVMLKEKGNIGVSSSQLVREYVEFQYTLYNDRSNLPIFDGWAEALNSLRENGWKIGIVTSRTVHSSEAILTKVELLGLFDVLIGGDSVDKHKPEPEPVLKALEVLSEKLGSELDKNEVLFVGDAKWDILCGKNAGVSTCLVEWAGDSEAFEVGPEFILQSPKDINV